MRTDKRRHHSPIGITPEQRELLERIVRAGITTRRHAERVFVRNERALIAAWARQLPMPAATTETK